MPLAIVVSFHRPLIMDGYNKRTSEHTHQQSYGQIRQIDRWTDTNKMMNEYNRWTGTQTHKQTYGQVQ